MPITSYNQSFITKVGGYIKIAKSITYSRFEAYDICHEQFAKAIRSNVFDYDNLALHLYAFLSSWGMVCRKSVLLQHNYKFLIDVVKIVCDNKYSLLLDINIFATNFNEYTYIDLVIELKNAIAKILNISLKSDTMTSKIMLGTLGCVPAYDTNVKKSLKKLGLCSMFSDKGLKDLLSFTCSQKNAILQLRTLYKTLNYSDMKYVDCYLW